MANTIEIRFAGNSSVAANFVNTATTLYTELIAYRTQTADNVNYQRSSTTGKESLIFSRTGAQDRFSVVARYLIDSATTEYCKVEVTGVLNGANWDITVDCTYEKKSTNTIKTARDFENIAVATLDAREYLCNFDTLIASNVAMFTKS